MCIILFAVAVFGFERPTYSGMEGTMREVCVVLQAPTTLGRQVIVNTASEEIIASDSATGKILNKPLYSSIICTL